MSLSFLLILWFYCASGLSLIPNTAASLKSRDDRIPPNTYHIFNAIHSSMRQWGSSLNHNGMSIFSAIVPAGTLLYHGTGTSTPIEGMEWLAFEPEHAALFAVKSAPRPKPPKSLKDSESDELPREPANLKWWPQSKMARLNHHQESVQDVLGEEGLYHAPRFTKPGWLHTYSAKRDLNLLYIDGMSAAKCDAGTLDTQDYLLLKENPPEGEWLDYERALNLCSLSRNRWSNRIDGFLRMEAGFEIILCSFVESLDLVRTVRKEPFLEDPDSIQRRFDMVFFSYYRAVASRYNGIGGNRVALNYEKFITTYAYEDIDLFTSPDGLPHLKNVSQTSLDPVMEELDNLVLNYQRPSPSGLSTDWQAVTDEVVSRYANRLQYLVSGKFHNLPDLSLEIDQIHLPFIDYDHRNSTAELERCTQQFVTPWMMRNVDTTSLAKTVILSVTRDICATVQSTADHADLNGAVKSIQDLIDRLNFTVWKECPGCASDEICVIPIWPWGSFDDSTHPRCANSTGFLKRLGRWDRRSFSFARHSR